MNCHIFIENGEYFLCIFDGTNSKFVHISKRVALECTACGMAVEGAGIYEGE